MDTASIAAAFIAQQASQLQTAVAAKMLRMNADSAKDAANLLQAASANASRLANVAARALAATSISQSGSRCQSTVVRGFQGSRLGAPGRMTKSYLFPTPR